jgi:hypothetical protein
LCPAANSQQANPPRCIKTEEVIIIVAFVPAVYATPVLRAILVLLERQASHRLCPVIDRKAVVVDRPRKKVATHSYPGKRY